ncbi:MAG: hypothetical protein K5769_08135 [Pseudobutyrivibrio sp.]|nr:hypothetical protein [Pseudobutyrivibrio sp.]
MKQLTYISVFLMFLVSCTGDKEVRAVLDRAEALMEAHPDSAYEELQSLLGNDSVSPSLGGVRGGPRTILLLAEAENKLYMQMPSDTAFQEVVDYYDRHGNANQRLKAYYLMGCIYRDMHEAPMALQWYLDATEQADTLAADCDYLTLMKVYGQMAGIYHSQLMPMEEIESRKMFSKCAEMMDSTYYVIRGIEKQLGAYQLMSDTAIILALTDSVHDLYLQAGMPQAAASVYPPAIHIYLARHDFRKAKQLMDIFEQESGLFDEEGNICKGREHYYESKGIYYEGIGKLDSAKYYYHLLADNGFNLDAYRGLIQVFRKQQLADSVLATVQRYEQAYQNYVNYKDIDAMRQVKSMYDYNRNQKIAHQKEIEATNTRNQLYLLIITFVAALAILIILFVIGRKRRNQRILSLSNTVHMAEKKIRELTEDTKILEFSHGTLTKSLNDKIQNYRKIATIALDTLNSLEKTNRVIDSGIVQKIYDCSYNPMVKVTEEQWQRFVDFAHHEYPELFMLLIEKKLTENERYVTLLTKYGFGNSQIANLLGKKAQHINNLKERANKKVFKINDASSLALNLQIFSK